MSLLRLESAKGSPPVKEHNKTFIRSGRIQFAQRQRSGSLPNLMASKGEAQVQKDAEASPQAARPQEEVRPQLVRTNSAGDLQEKLRTLCSWMSTTITKSLASKIQQLIIRTKDTESMVDVLEIAKLVSSLKPVTTRLFECLTSARS